MHCKIHFNVLILHIKSYREFILSKIANQQPGMQIRQCYELMLIGQYY